MESKGAGGGLCAAGRDIPRGGAGKHSGLTGVKCDHLLVEEQDAEQRIAELERQLAAAKVATGNAQPVRQPQFAYGGQGAYPGPGRVLSG